jgi:transposase
VLALTTAVRVYLAATPVDMRNSIDGLMAIVRNQWGADVFSGHLFAFVSRRGDRIKILTWASGGFVLYYKRLERGRFRMPQIADDARSIEIDATQLAMLLDGIDYTHVRRPDRWNPQAARAAGIDKGSRL